MPKNFSIESAGHFARFETVTGAELRSGVPPIHYFAYKELTGRARRDAMNEQLKEASAIFQDRAQTAANGNCSLEIDISSPISPEDVLARIEAMVNSKGR